MWSRHKRFKSIFFLFFSLKVLFFLFVYVCTQREHHDENQHKKPETKSCLEEKNNFILHKIDDIAQEWSISE